MKKYFLLAAAAATVLAVSCNKEKEQPKVDPTPGTEIEDNTPQPILFGSNVADVKAPITKAAIEKTGTDKGWSDSDLLFIYGFSVTSTGAPDFSKDPIIDNVGAKAPGQTAAADERTAFTGDHDAIYVYKDATNKEYFYYGEDVYNFYGYYVGSAAADPQPTKTADAVTLDLTLDGTQDIMLGKTDKFADYIAANPTGLSLEKVYSEVSARKNVKPDLLFQHQLARFKFEAKYGGPVPANAANIKIDTIGINAHTKGVLTIVNTDEEKIGLDTLQTGNVRDTLFLKDKAGTQISNVGITSSFAQVGESIMVIPEGSSTEHAKYTMYVGVTQTDGTVTHHELRPYTIDFDALVDKDGNPILNKYAEAGKMYVVRLVIYGFEKIEMTVSLEDWEYGGETEIDPDQDNRPVPVFTFTAPNPEQTLNLNVAATQQITVSAKYTALNAAEPTDIASDAIKYGTTNKKVATVSAGGLITAVKPGDCKVYVYVEADANNKYQGALKAIDVHVNAPVEITCADQTISKSGANVELANIATFSTGYAGTVTYALKTGETYTHATVTSAGVVSIDGSAAAGDTFQVTISAADDATNNFQAATKDVTFTVTD